jgi:GT2 family glycosyltransferase
MARGPIVELLNDDTEVCTGWAESALRHFEHPRVAAVAPLVLQKSSHHLHRSAPVIDSAGDGYDPGGYAWKRGHGQTWSERLPLELRRSGPVTSASACAAFYRRPAVLAVGGFEDAFDAYFEDVDLGLRLRQQGADIVFEPASIVWHWGSTSYSRTPQRSLIELQSRNEEHLFWRHWRQYGGPRLLLRHAGILAAKAGRRWTEGCLLPWIFGRLRAWTTLIRAMGLTNTTMGLTNTTLRNSLTLRTSNRDLVRYNG